MERVRYISVPLNEKGIEDYNYGKEESNNIRVFQLKEDEYNNIDESGIFNEINNSCDLLIDDYESEEIKGNNLEIALDISKKNECEVLIQALELAIENNTLVGLDF
jgi:hypothetical protein